MPYTFAVATGVTPVVFFPVKDPFRENGYVWYNKEFELCLPRVIDVPKDGSTTALRRGNFPPDKFCESLIAMRTKA
jgi:hypothetical protein